MLFRKNEEKLYMPIDGKLMGIETSEDKLFASKAMGDGFLVIPSSQKLTSPVSGTIRSIFPTKHAIGIETAQGHTLLIHIGIDTVDLNGTPFDLKVSENQKINHGETLAIVDFDYIKNAGKSTQVMFVLTDSESYSKLTIENSVEKINNEYIGEIYK